MLYVLYNSRIWNDNPTLYYNLDKVNYDSVIIAFILRDTVALCEIDNENKRLSDITDEIKNIPRRVIEAKNELLRISRQDRKKMFMTDKIETERSIENYPVVETEGIFAWWSLNEIEEKVKEYYAKKREAAINVIRNL